LGDLGVLSQMPVDDLDRDVALEALVVRAVHRCHPTMANLFAHLVLLENWPWVLCGQRHRVPPPAPRAQMLPPRIPGPSHLENDVGSERSARVMCARTP